MKIINLSKTFESKNGFKKVAIRDLSFVLPNKGLISIVGHSGSGKSTLLNIIGGLEKPTSGDIIINTPMSSWSENDIIQYRRNTVSFIFQEFNLFDNMTIKENLSLAVLLNENNYDQNYIDELLVKFDLPKDIINKYPSEVSIGQRQRLALIRAIIKKANIYLIDEPTGSLDEKISKQIMEYIKEISKESLVIMVTHEKDLVEAYSDRIIELEDGKIISDRNISCIEENGGDINLNKRKLSFKPLMLIIKSNFRQNKSKLRKMASILTVVFFLFSFLFVLLENPISELRYNSFKSVSNVVSITKSGHGNEKHISQKDYLNFNDNYNQKALPVFCISNSPYDNILRTNFRIYNKTVSIGDRNLYFSSNFSSYYSIFFDLKPQDYGLELVYGRLPQAIDEIVITLYQYERYAYMYSNINEFKDVNKLDLTLELDIRGSIPPETPLKIVGIVDTNHHKSNYGEFVKDFNENDLLDSKKSYIYSCWQNEKELIHNLIFFDTSFFEIVFKSYGITTWFYNENIEYELEENAVLTSNYKQAGTFIKYFDGVERETLNDNEIIIDDRMINLPNYSLTSNVDDLNLNKNGYRSLIYKEAYKYSVEHYEDSLIKDNFTNAEEYAKYIMNNRINIYDEEHNYAFFLKQFWDNNFENIANNFKNKKFVCKNKFGDEEFEIVGIKVTEDINFYNTYYGKRLYLSENRVQELISKQEYSEHYDEIYNYLLVALSSTDKDNTDFLKMINTENGAFESYNTPYMNDINNQLDIFSTLRTIAICFIPILLVFIAVYVYHNCSIMVNNNRQKDNMLETLGLSKRNIILTYLVQNTLIALISEIIGIVLLFILKKVISVLFINVYAPEAVVMNCVSYGFNIILIVLAIYLLINIAMTYVSLKKNRKVKTIQIYRKD